MLRGGDIGMWTGKLAMRCALVSYAFLLFACGSQPASRVDQDKPIVVWWYNIDFQPKSGVVHGIDVRAIDERWRRADALDPRDLEGCISQDDIR